MHHSQTLMAEWFLVCLYMVSMNTQTYTAKEQSFGFVVLQTSGHCSWATYLPDLCKSLEIKFHKDTPTVIRGFYMLLCYYWYLVQINTHYPSHFPRLNNWAPGQADSIIWSIPEVIPYSSVRPVSPRLHSLHDLWKGLDRLQGPIHICTPLKPPMCSSSICKVTI